MSAQPEHRHDQHAQHDPQEILAALPPHWRRQFQQEYEDAVQAALRPESYRLLQEMLHRWWLKSIALADPGFDEAARRAGDGTAETTPIGDVVPDWEQRVGRARARR
ncbi:DUF6247 family protein [Nonomuraea sp. NPDC050478]|uniref:DUF6247 family protein n=1 Tax=Nonomuraea sp. NPDC050478 TaxID=3364365 RepID=UPI0037B90237